MTKVIKVIALGSLLASSAAYAVSIAACVGCHGQHFEKVALGKSKIVKDMSKADIVAALKGYQDGSYGGAMKGVMKGQVVNLSDTDISAIADIIKGGEDAAENTAAVTSKVINLNDTASSAERIAKEDLAAKKVITEEELGLRKVDLYSEDKAAPSEGKFTRAAAGSADRFERAYTNAPPMIPHDVEGMLPIVKGNNACLGCHMPDVAPSVNATAIPASHFANFRPATSMAADGKITKEGKEVDNTSDFKTVVKKMDKLNPARFNCSQCHAPQANIDPLVGNTFQPDFGSDEQKSKSNLLDVINAGVK